MAGRVELNITFECPACKQVNEAPFSKVIEIETTSEYAGSGSYFGMVSGVTVTCTGCKVETDIEWL
jgi:hypothetical protein